MCELAENKVRGVYACTQKTVDCERSEAATVSGCAAAAASAAAVAVASVAAAIAVAAFTVAVAVVPPSPSPSRMGLPTEQMRHVSRRLPIAASVVRLPIAASQTNRATRVPKMLLRVPKMLLQ